MKIFGKRIGVTKTKNIKNGDYKDRAEKLKKLEENLVKTVEKYSDYAKKIVTGNSGENISDKMKQIVCFDIEKLFLEEKLINIKYENNILDNIWGIVTTYEDYYKNFTANLRVMDQKLYNALDSSENVTKLYNNISDNFNQYGKKLICLKGLIENEADVSNKQRKQFVEDSKKIIDNIYIDKESFKTCIKNMLDCIEKYPENTYRHGKIEIDKIIFNKFDTEYEKFSSNNNECFNYEIVGQIIDEYGKVKKILDNVSTSTLVLQHSVSDCSEKQRTEVEKYDGYYNFLNNLLKSDNEFDTVDELKNKLKKKFSTYHKIFKDIDDEKNSNENNRKSEIKKIEKNFTNKYKNKEIIKLKNEKFSELEKNCSYTNDENSIEERKQELDNKIKETKSNIKDNETTKKSYDIIQEFSKYNKTNKVLSIGGIKYSYKIYCEKISSNQKKLIDEAKDTQKIAKKAKQIIKDIYDLENKISKLDESKKKNEIDIKIINLKEEYGENIQKLSNFSVTIGDLKIVDVDKLKL